MGKHDLKFFASAIGGLAVLLGLGGHSAKLWLAQNPTSLSGSWDLLGFLQMAIYAGTALWIWALAALLRSRGYSTTMSLSGLLMIVPFVGLIPWFLILSAEDKLADSSDELMTGKRFELQRLEAGAVNVRYASDWLDRDKRRYDEVEKTYDPWAKPEIADNGASKAKAAPIRRTSRYRW